MPASPIDTLRLQRLAYHIRQQALTMIYQAQSGHPASSLGLADLLTVLYFAKILRYDPQRPDWNKRDYLFVSNGHISALIYATLAKAGFFAESELNTFRQINSRLQGHLHYLSKGAEKLPGVENTGGPLGQGLSQAAGLAYALRMDGKKNRVFCLMSDAEQQEGQTWEAYNFIVAKKLTNLLPIIDCNNIQISGSVAEVMPLGNLRLRLISWGFQVTEVDGHNYQQLLTTLSSTKNSAQPQLILLKTIPGKGVAFMEKDYRWHGRAPNQSEFQQAMRGLKIRAKTEVADG